MHSRTVYLGFRTYGLQFTARISSQQSKVALAPDLPEVQDLLSTIHSANLESAIQSCTCTGSTWGSELTRYNSQYESRVSTRTGSTWGSGLTIYNLQSKARISNPLNSHRIYLRFRTYSLQFIARVSSQESKVALAPDLPGVQDLQPTTHNAKLESAIHCTRTRYTWGSGITLYNTQHESRVSNPKLHLHRIYLRFRTYSLQFTVLESAIQSCTCTGSTWGSELTRYNSQYESAIHCTRKGLTCVRFRPLTFYSSQSEAGISIHCTGTESTCVGFRPLAFCYSQCEA